MELHPGRGRRYVPEVKSVEVDPIRRALQENEDWYRDLVEHSQDLLCIHDLQGRLLSVNPSPARVLGYTVEELIQIPMQEILAPEFRPQFDAYLVQIGSKGEAKGLMAVMTRTGERRIWEYRNTLRTEGVASPIVRGMAHDVTERMRAEKELQAAAELNRQIVAGLREGVILFDRDLRYRVWNPFMEEMTGLSSEQVLGRHVLEVFPEAKRYGIYDRLLRSLQGETVEVPDTYDTSHPEPRWVSARHTPVRDSKGEIAGVIVAVDDITQRKRAASALEESENRFRVVYQRAPVGMCLVETRTGRFLQVNPKYCEIVGRTEEDLLCRDVQSISHPDDIAEGEEKMRQLADGELQRFEMEKRYLRPDGSVRWVSVLVVRMCADDDVLIWNMAIVQDVTELREVTDQLRRAKEKLTEEKLYLEQEIHSELGFGEIVGQSRALNAVMEQVGHVASSDATVLLLGETGTGKELIARAIHQKSTRRGSSFIKVNCAAIPSGLLESELFGHEKGAFTGAVSKKIGRLELADRGTLFLDEIGEIPLALQPKLLRVLQDQEFERLGGTQTLKVDFRLIAATNRDLSQSMKEGQFRSDLYYRLNVFPVRVPPLRERREDIQLLVEHFVQLSASRMNRSITSIPKKTMNTLMQWNWPGNIRELENFIERSVILTQGSVLAAPINELIVIREEGSGNSLKAKEREHILRALEQSRGQLSGPRGAAARLGLPRSTLQWKLKQLGINHQQYRD
jgi:formate hydrogenlyase transcriptional activator